MPGPSTLPSIIAGLATLRANPLRTVLSTLGIIIGVAALVAVLALGDGLERFGRQQIERTTDVQSILVAPRLTQELDGQPIPVTDFPVFTPDDRAALARLPGVGAVLLSASGSGRVASGRGPARGAALTFTSGNGATFLGLELAAGRFYTDAEALHGAPVVVLSHRLATELSPGGDPTSMVDREVRVSGLPRRVIGVLAPVPGERGFRALLPIETARLVLGGAPSPLAPQLLIRAARVEEVDRVKARAEDWAAGHIREWERRVRVETNSRRLEQVQRSMLLFRIFLGAITAISLVVGGIGIMNVLLAAVTERTREIGIRKATGARSRDLLVQFLAESVAITGTGSLLGTVLGLGSAFAITAFMRAHSEALVFAAVTPVTLAVAALSAVVVGITFGIYPALRAARLSPIDAIRHE